MTEQEAIDLAEEITMAALPDLELLNILEGGLPEEPGHWIVRCRYTGPEKWIGRSIGITPGMTMSIMNTAGWEETKDVIINGKEEHPPYA